MESSAREKLFFRIGVMLMMSEWTWRWAQRCEWRCHWTPWRWDAERNQEEARSPLLWDIYGYNLHFGGQAERVCT